MSADATEERRAGLRLVVGSEDLAVVRLPAASSVPDWVQLRRGRSEVASEEGTLVSVTFTNEELSIVLPHALVPRDLQNASVESGWRSIKVSGQLDFALVGILASLAVPLARAGVSIFALSTYNTDYVLVKSHSLETAVRTLRENGHEMVLPHPTPASVPAADPSHSG